MGQSYQCIRLAGRLARDPRAAGSVMFMTLVTDRKGFDAQDRTDYHDVMMVGALKDIGATLHKGDFVLVEGHLEYRSVDKNDERLKYKMEATIVAEYAVRGAEKREGGNRGAGGPPGTGASPGSGAPSMPLEQRTFPGFSSVYPYTDNNGVVWLAPSDGWSRASGPVQGWEAIIHWTDPALPEKGGAAHGRKDSRSKWARWEKLDPAKDLDEDIPF